jgi:hypothetical protein
MVRCRTAIGPRVRAPDAEPTPGVAAHLARMHDRRLAVLGHVVVWDPAIGRINLIQGLRVSVHHDLHHDRIVRRVLGR